MDRFYQGAKFTILTTFEEKQRYSKNSNNEQEKTKNEAS